MGGYLLHCIMYIQDDPGGYDCVQLSRRGKSIFLSANLKLGAISREQLIIVYALLHLFKGLAWET